MSPTLNPLRLHRLFAYRSCTLAVALAVVSLVLGFAPPFPTASAASEIDKLKEIQATIERQGMAMPVHWQSKLTNEQYAFCEQFLDDLTSGKDIEVVEPVLRTDDPNHRDLGRYQSSCRDAKPSSVVNYRDLSSIGTHGFRLYRIDLDGNTKNGAEELLYAEGNPRAFGNGTYHRVDLQECSSRYVTVCCNTVVKSQEGFPRVVSNTNALIQYQGKGYVIEMRGEVWRKAMML